MIRHDPVRLVRSSNDLPSLLNVPSMVVTFRIISEPTIPFRVFVILNFPTGM